MLLVGGLTALQQAAVLGSVPFTFVLVGVAWCWIKALRAETRGADDRAVTPTPVRASSAPERGGPA
jgi:glycine betaine transporter